MTALDAAQIKVAVDTVLDRTRMQVPPDEYARLLDLYPQLLAQAAELRLPELRNREPAIIYPARSSSSD
jgi:hypothetical protein